MDARTVGGVLAAAAGAVVLGLAGAAFAEPGSPYLYPVRHVCSLGRENSIECVTKRPKTVVQRLDKMIAALDAAGPDGLSQAAALRKIAPHLKRVSCAVPAGVVDDAATGLLAEFEDVVALILPYVEQDAAKPSALARALRAKVAATQKAIAAARAQRSSVARRVSLTHRAAASLLAAIDRVSKITTDFAYVWLRADSIGPAGTPYVRGTNCRVTVHDGYPRRWVVYVPQTALFQPGEPAPVVGMHHGTSGTGEKYYLHSGWKEKAEETGLVCYFPTALEYKLVSEGGNVNTRFNGYSLASDIDEDPSDPDLDVTYKPLGYPSSAPFPADDIGFTRAILDDLGRPGSGITVDARRIYITGFSNGAQFTTRCGVELTDVLAAIAYTSAAIGDTHCADGVTEDPACPNPPIPAIGAVGARDDRLLDATNAHLPADQQIATFPLAFSVFGQLPAFLQTFCFDPAATYQLDTTQYTVDEQPTYTSLRFATPANGNTAGNTFTFLLLAGVTHQYPRANNNPNGFDAADTFWTFFAANPKP